MLGQPDLRVCIHLLMQDYWSEGEKTKKINLCSFSWYSGHIDWQHNKAQYNLEVLRSCTIVVTWLPTCSIFSLNHNVIDYLGTCDEGVLCSLLVGSLSLPCSKSRGLESTSIREAQLPGSVQRKLVHGIQIQRSLLLTLTTREEADAWEPEERCWTFEEHSKWTPSSEDQWRTVLPGTAAGTVRLRAVTVAMATSWGVYFLVQECPAVTMFGLSRVPSRYTWWSERALYTAARTFGCNLLAIIFDG